MWTTIIGALVSLLIFFFQRWWTAHHPIAPTAETKAAFLAEVQRPLHFWMGPNRAEYAGKLFDKFAEKYQANPPMQGASASALSEQQAGELAAKIADGLTLDPSELAEAPKTETTEKP